MDINISNLTFNYRGSRKEVMHDLNLQLTENRICGLLGKNGVGKSTLLYLIAGLLTPVKGTVKVGGMESCKGNPDMLRDLFIVTEEFSLPKVKLSEYVKMNAPFYPNFSEEMLLQCLADFELIDSTTTPPLREGDGGRLNLAQLSMGQKKKVFMSFALAANTGILLMDEPTNGLDIPSKAQFRKAVSRSMTDDRIIIISTHQVHDIEQLLDHVVILSNEGVLLNATTQEICDKYVFEYRTPDNMQDALYAEPTLQGNAVIAPRGNNPETLLNLELLFNAATQKTLETHPLTPPIKGGE